MDENRAGAGLGVEASRRCRESLAMAHVTFEPWTAVQSGYGTQR